MRMLCLWLQYVRPTHLLGETYRHDAETVVQLLLELEQRDVRVGVVRIVNMNLTHFYWLGSIA